MPKRKDWDTRNETIVSHKLLHGDHYVPYAPSALYSDIIEMSTSLNVESKTEIGLGSYPSRKLLTESASAPEETE